MGCGRGCGVQERHRRREVSQPAIKIKKKKRNQSTCVGSAGDQGEREVKIRKERSAAVY